MHDAGHWPRRRSATGDAAAESNEGRSVDTNNFDAADRSRAGEDQGSAEPQRLGGDERDVVQQLGENADALRALADDLKHTQDEMARARAETERLASRVRAARDAMRRTQERIRRTGAKIIRLDDEQR
jgi:hypothetical protein